MRALLKAAALAAAVFLSAGPAAAHDFHVGMTDISWNERTRSTEIVHSFVLHDLVTALSEEHHPLPEFDTPEGVAILRAYMDKHFAIESRERRKLPLRWVGASMDAQNITIYQELPGVRPGPGFLLQDAVLVGQFASQVNTVNLRLGGPVRTLQFDRGLLRQPLR